MVKVRLPTPKPKPVPVPPPAAVPKKPESITSKAPKQPEISQPPPSITPSRSEVDSAVRQNTHTAKPGAKDNTWKQELVSAGPSYISAAATTGIKVAGAVQASNMVSNFVTGVGDKFSHVGEGIEEAVSRLQSGAHSFGSFVAQPLQTGISAVVVIGGLVFAYEVYRYLK